MNLNSHVGQLLKLYIKKNGINASRIARLMDVTPQTLQTIYSSKNPQEETLNKLLAALGISMDDLYQFEESQNNENVINKDKKKTVEIPMTDFEYLMNAVRERDELQKKEIERLEKLNRVEASELLKH
jgi:transcriptional regulator with XRE-family HTH domain